MAKTHLIFPVLPTSKFHTALILENRYTRKGIGSSNPPLRQFNLLHGRAYDQDVDDPRRAWNANSFDEPS